MNQLETFLAAHIKSHGPIDVGQFMTMALGHPQHGYYMKQDPFGRGGDFTTAPEISQMFGEMIGAWAADIWMQMGSPARISLVECGPGRGTLMADIVRILPFKDQCDVHFVEMSPVLRELQRKAVPKATWHESVESIPDNQPVILIGNEFLDALPMRQYEFVNGTWAERVVAIDGDGFVWGRRAAGVALPAGKDGDVFEVAPVRESFTQNMCALLKRAGGVGIMIDYGHSVSGMGDTLQAVAKHKYAPVLENIGDADLTSHVDFEAIGAAAAQAGAKVLGAVEQGEFLQRLGITARAAYLASKSKDAGAIETALKRLTDSDQMGTLFKVMAFTYDPVLQPAGF